MSSNMDFATELNYQSALSSMTPNSGIDFPKSEFISLCDPSTYHTVTGANSFPNCLRQTDENPSNAQTIVQSMLLPHSNTSATTGLDNFNSSINTIYQRQTAETKNIIPTQDIDLTVFNKRNNLHTNLICSSESYCSLLNPPATCGKNESENASMSRTITLNSVSSLNNCSHMLDSSDGSRKWSRLVSSSKSGEKKINSISNSTNYSRVLSSVDTARSLLKSSAINQKSNDSSSSSNSGEQNLNSIASSINNSEVFYSSNTSRKVPHTHTVSSCSNFGQFLNSAAFLGKVFNSRASCNKTIESVTTSVATTNLNTFSSSQNNYHLAYSTDTSHNFFNPSEDHLKMNKSRNVAVKTESSIVSNFANNLHLSGSSYSLKESDTKIDSKDDVAILPTQIYQSFQQNDCGKTGYIMPNIQSQTPWSTDTSFASTSDSLQENVAPFSVESYSVDAATVQNMNGLKYSTKEISISDLLDPLDKYFKDNKCLICGFVSKSKQRYQARHHLATHIKSKNFKCDDCGKTFSTPTNLSIHMNLHSSVYSYSCDICGENFLNRPSLQRHLKKHKSSKKYQCTLCQKEYNSPTGLREHQRIHTGEKPYICLVCSKSFRTTSMLKNHSFQHNLEKLYKCTLCDKGYNIKSLLAQHMSSQHENSSFKCEICEKSFNFHSNLHQHKLVHTNARQHACEICGMKFKLPHHLKNHLSTHDASEI